MDRIYISRGSAELLGLLPKSSEIIPSAIFLMNIGKCLHDCAFCARANSVTEGEDRLAHISWPEFNLVEILDAIKDNNSFKRICIQWTNTEENLDDLLELSREVKSVTNKPLSVSVRTTDKIAVRSFIEMGVDKVSLSLKVIREDDFAKIRGGRQKSLLNFIIRMAGKFPGKIVSHLMIGFSETEKDVVECLRKLKKAGVLVSFFAFTPVKGIKLEHREPPSLDKYRRLQVAYFFVKKSLDHHLVFNDEGRIISFGFSEHEFRELLLGTRVFEVNGCEGCTRPYYNERIGGTLYNWPRTLTEEEFEQCLAQLKL